ncbi:MAG: J domain-containing protein [Vicinamibacterales bacterium]
MPRRDYYRVLHVHPDAPDEIIKVSYRTLMQRLKMHPDLGGDHATATLINEAFRTLGHPDRRAAYDQWLETPLESPAQAAATPQAPRDAQPDPSIALCAFCSTPYETGYERHPDSACRSCGGALYPVQRFETDEESRRALARLPRNMMVVFARPSPNDAPCRGVTQDVSLAGMRFVTSSPVGIDDRLLIETEFCSAVAIVRSAHQKPAAQNGWEVGVQFLTMRVKRQRGGLISTVA